MVRPGSVLEVGQLVGPISELYIVWLLCGINAKQQDTWWKISGCFIIFTYIWVAKFCDVLYANTCMTFHC